MGSGKTRAPSGVTRYDARLLDRAFDPSLAQVFSDERRQVNLYCAQVILDQDAAIGNELGKDAKAWEYGAHYWEGEAKRLDRERSDLEVKLARVTEERDAGRCACVVSPDMEEPVSSCDYHEKQAADLARVTAERDALIDRFSVGCAPCSMQDGTDLEVRHLPPKCEWPRAQETSDEPKSSYDQMITILAESLPNVCPHCVYAMYYANEGGLYEPPVEHECVKPKPFEVKP